MTEPVTAKREPVSKVEEKEDNASVKEIMVGSKYRSSETILNGGLTLQNCRLRKKNL